ncbi:biosynthetic-type acetolactate synthase large subunit [Alphaproteobacteria bacterium]|nr:biosynthetic-type acetolactate synthase large subunit [Alphaproteobacteria bacterium]MDC1022929.1 biosynthetic-type acetolactate synthase large subunit [Alphaproteobacteria bacterium]
MSNNYKISGAEAVIKALVENGVEVIFGYPGGAVLPLYDALFKNKKIKHILVRHEQAAVHAAEGYARSTGKVGCVLVTSGPGATNAITGLTDALMDSVPIVCLSGQVPTHLIGTDAFQEADTTGISRPCTKHNYLVKNADLLCSVVHEAFEIAASGRPGPVLIDLPKDIQLTNVQYLKKPSKIINKLSTNLPKIDVEVIKLVAHLLINSKKPIIYAGGGVVNAGSEASNFLTELVDLLDAPVTLTLMGLGAVSNKNKNFLGMLGMHGTYEANLTMHNCDVMLNVGARFDDRVTGRLNAFAPKSKKIHIDIDKSSINKVVHVDYGIVGDCKEVLFLLIKEIKKYQNKKTIISKSSWWKQIDEWRSKNSLGFLQTSKTIKPQQAIKSLYEKTLNIDTYITTEVGQHQMWAAQYFGFSAPKHWMTSGGLGTMGYGLPSSVGVQIAHPKSLVIDISGEASFLMNMQELSTIVQYNLPVKIFILNNQWMGMVRQWQELNHGSRYSESYTSSLPDFVMLAKSFGIKGMQVDDIKNLDSTIDEMINTNGPVLADIRVEKEENCFPMIPSGAAHNEMILSSDDKSNDTSESGLALV